VRRYFGPRPGILPLIFTEHSPAARRRPGSLARVVVFCRTLMRPRPRTEENGPTEPGRGVLGSQSGIPLRDTPLRRTRSFGIAASRLGGRRRLSTHQPAEPPRPRTTESVRAEAGRLNARSDHPRRRAGGGCCLRALVAPDAIDRSEHGTLFFLRRRARADARLRTLGHNGMFPCLRGASVSRFVSSISSALMSRGRVSRGSITSSTYPRSAAT